jgi:hypothetical protein
MATWRAAARALEAQRTSELRDLTDDAARAATLALLELGASTPLPPERVSSSGLVEQQAILHRLRG